MKETAEQIVKRYKADPSRENMQQIALDNDCTMQEIGEFLKDAATPKKKPGRPKSKEASERKKIPSEAIKKRKNEKVSNKSDSVERKMLAKTYLIPPVMLSIGKEKAEEYRRLAEIHKVKARELELQAIEIEDFLEGGFTDGNEN